MIVRRGYRKPPSYHIDRLRTVPNGYIYDVITNGFGAMPDYAAQIEPRDRWAIVSYVRALQLSQNAPLHDVPPDALSRLGPAPQPAPGGGQMMAQALDFTLSEELRNDLRTWRTRAGAVGLAALVALIAGAFFEPTGRAVLAVVVCFLCGPGGRLHDLADGAVSLGRRLGRGDPEAL